MRLKNSLVKRLCIVSYFSCINGVINFISGHKLIFFEANYQKTILFLIFIKVHLVQK